jgi:hypothetical protein
VKTRQQIATLNFKYQPGHENKGSYNMGEFFKQLVIGSLQDTGSSIIVALPSIHLDGSANSVIFLFNQGMHRRQGIQFHLSSKIAKKN